MCRGKLHEKIVSDFLIWPLIGFLAGKLKFTLKFFVLFVCLRGRQVEGVIGDDFKEARQELKKVTGAGISRLVSWKTIVGSEGRPYF